MLLNLTEYHWAEQLDDALLLLGRLDVKTVPLAGGTYLFTLHDDSIQAVVDLRDLDLDFISEDARGLHIGAMTPLQTIADAPLLKEYAAGLLAKAALYSSSSPLIRNSATIGGTLGAGSASQADLLTALVALDAEVVLRSASRTQVSLGAGSSSLLSGIVYKGKHERRVACSEISIERRPSELITEVQLGRCSYSSGASFMRVAQTATDGALVNVAAFVEVDNTTYQKVRLVCGGINMEPIRLQAIEQQLEGQAITDVNNGQQILAALRAGMNEFRPPADARVSSGYRRVAGMNLAYRALEEATKIAHWRATITSTPTHDIHTTDITNTSSQPKLEKSL